MSISRAKNNGAIMKGTATSAISTSCQPRPEKLPMSQ
jgi:hypothetical protein